MSYTRQNLNEVFEKLSGSDQFKEEYERLNEQKTVFEAKLRQVTELLKEKRHEKVKVKGLSDY